MPDLRAQAAGLRQTYAPKPAAEPPKETGRRLATVPRGTDGKTELRLSWELYESRPYLSLRQWNADANGGWWPDKTKGCTIRLRELADLCDGLAVALDLAAEHAAGQRGGAQ